MKKRAQIFGEPFIFIFAIVVAAMVFIFGIKIYYDLNQRADFAQVADTVQRINEQVTTFYNLDEGSENTFTFTFPSSIECFCFVGATTALEDIRATPGHCADSTFKQKMQANLGLGKKVFWKYSEKTKKGENPANLPDVSPINSEFITKTASVGPNPPAGLNPLCFDLVSSNYKLRIKFTSQGDKVLISNP